METTVIKGEHCVFHSVYKGAEIYRAWNMIEHHGKMRYFGVFPNGVIVEQKSLGTVKKAISREASA